MTNILRPPRAEEYFKLATQRGSRSEGHIRVEVRFIEPVCGARDVSRNRIYGLHFPPVAFSRTGIDQQ